MTRAVSSTAILLVLLLTGCTTLGSATEDETRLHGEIPAGLGRTLEVRIEAGNRKTRGELFQALRREFVGGDLFDRVRRVPLNAPPSRLANATLWVALDGSSSGGLFDLWALQDAYVARYEMDIELRDAQDHQVLQGHISGVAADDVTQSNFLDDAKKEDVRLAALADAAMKMSRALRQAANARAAKAMAHLHRIQLPAGVGPVQLAVLGFDDDPSARIRHGWALALQLDDALRRLGPEFEVTASSEVERVLEREKLPDQFLDIQPYELERFAKHLSGVRSFIVGKVAWDGDQVQVEGKLLDRDGRTVLDRKATAHGLGALRVVAAKLAALLGEGIRRQGT